jgi:hypothetical protein
MLPISGVSQIPVESASDVVKFITRPSLEDLFGGCGSISKYRAAAKSLERMGTSAIPDIEKALESIENYGLKSDFSNNVGWLLYAYAGLRRQAAYPRFRRMVTNRNWRVS